VIGMFKIRKPHNKKIDEALVKGSVDFPAAPTGLYLRRMAKYLDGAVNIRPKGRDLFEAIRGEHAIEKVGESTKYAFYKRRGRWSDLL